jgi:hypothetical protein
MHLFMGYRHLQNSGIQSRTRVLGVKKPALFSIVSLMLLFFGFFTSMQADPNNPYQWPIDADYDWNILTQTGNPPVQAPFHDFTIERLDAPPYIVTYNSRADTLKTDTTYTSDATGRFAIKTKSYHPTDSAVQLIWRTSISQAQGSIDMRFWAPKIKYFTLNENGDTIPFPANINTLTGERIPVIVRLYEDENGDSGDRLCTDWTDSVGAHYNITYTLKDWRGRDACNPSDLNIISLPGSDSLIFYEFASGGVTKVDSLFFQNSQAVFYLSATAAVSDGGFRIDGLYGPDNTPRISKELEASIDFVYPDAPVLQSAVLYDTDGDGLGDSLVVRYSMNLEVSPDSLFATWPTGDSIKNLRNDGLDITYSGSVVTIVDTKGILDPALLPDLDKEGVLRSVITATSGRKVADSTDIVDSIGPVLLNATLIGGFAQGEDPDTLIVELSKPLNGEFDQGPAFLLANGDKITGQGELVEGRIWKFIIPPGDLTPGDSIRLNYDFRDVTDSEKIISDDGNAPSRNNQLVGIQDAAKYPALANTGNGFYDANEDGTMDSVTFQFVKPLTDVQLSNLDIRFYWKDSSGNTIELKPNPEDLDIIQATQNGHQRFAWKVPQDVQLQPKLTSIDDRTYGYANVISGYVIGDQDFLDTAGRDFEDKIAPVIDSVWIQPELKKDSRGDRLTIVFSEPIDTASITNTDFLQFKSGDRQKPFMDLTSLEWDSTGRVLTARLAEDLELELRPDAGDSISIGTVGSGIGIKDASGNEVGGNVPFVMMNGDPRVLIRSMNLLGFDRASMQSEQDVDAITVQVVDDETTIKDLESQGVIGHLLDFGASPLANEDGEVDLSDIYMRYEIYYYTNFGGFVAELKGEIYCDDPAFSADGTSQGDCFKNRRKVLIRWNFKSDKGRVVGYGAYVTRLFLFVKGAKDNFEQTDTRTIGIHAGDGAYRRSFR